MRQLMQRLFALLLLPVLLLQTSFAASDDIARLFTFTPGTTIQSSQVNAELNQIISTMNTKAGRGVNNAITGSSTFSGTNTFSNTTTFNNGTLGLKTDTIGEYTSGAGVTVGGTLLKSGYIRPVLSSDPTTVEGNLWYNSTSHLLKFYDGTNTQTVSVGQFPTGYRYGSHPTWTSVASVTIPAGYKCRDASDSANIVVGSDLVVSLASSGALGLDSGSEASNSWYYLWLASGASGTTAVFSLSATVPVLPTGYTSYKRRIPGAWRNDGSSNLINQTFSGSIYAPTATWNVDYGHYGAAGTSTVLSAGTATTYTDVDLSSWVSPDSQIALLKTDSFNNSHTIYVKTKGSSVDMYSAATGATNSSTFGMFTMPTDASRLVQYKVASGILYLAVTGYQVTGGS